LSQAEEKDVLRAPSLEKKVSKAKNDMTVSARKSIFTEATGLPQGGCGKGDAQLTQDAHFDPEEV